MVSDRGGAIILLNGASSCGKSSLARAVQRTISAPFCHISIGHLRDAGVLPMDRTQAGDLDWASLREAFFTGFEASVTAYALAG
jgi:chloramphenicol 3-O phosphotransferase